MRSLFAVLAGAVALAGTADCAIAQSPLRLMASQRNGIRMQDLTFTTPALSAPTHVRVLLPAGYDASGKTRYPTLYLLHGAQSPVDFGPDMGWQSWTTNGLDAQAVIGAAHVIAVMPDSGPRGGYVDWYNGGAYGPPRWETYHLDQLVPWIDSHYPTITDRSARAVAGASMGGYGAIEYAARRPDLFIAAAGFSPAVDITDPGLVAQNSASDAAGDVGVGRGQGADVYGPYATNLVYYRGRNPVDLAENLDGVNVALHTGNGYPGGPNGNGSDPVEGDVHAEALMLHNALATLGIPHIWDDYGPGNHSSYYWQRDLAQAFPWIMNSFAHPAAPPTAVTYRSIDSSYSVYGWTVKLERPVREFSELRAADSSGFELRGSGTAMVVTPGVFQPGSSVRAVAKTRLGKRSLSLQADARGSVSVALDLGPSSAYDEYSPQAAAGDGASGAQSLPDGYLSQPAVGSPGTVIYTARVDLSGPAAKSPPGNPAGNASPCTSRRRIAVTLPRAYRRAKRARVRIGALRSGTVAIRDGKVIVDLRHAPRGRFRVTILIGGLAVDRRTFHTCTPGHRSP